MGVLDNGLHHISLFLNQYKWPSIDISFPSRGLGQGDPLSPYLFLICEESLAHKIENVSLHGLKILRYCPPLMHLIFADDSILYSKASKREAVKIRKVLREYAATCGQTINLAKSSFIFIPNTSRRVRQVVVTTLRIGNFESPDKFLGLPTNISRSPCKHSTFNEGGVFFH